MVMVDDERMRPRHCLKPELCATFIALHCWLGDTRDIRLCKITKDIYFKGFLLEQVEE